MKLFPIPNMSPVADGKWRLFSIPTVQAQMSPMGSSYAYFFGGNDEAFYGTSITDGTSSCYCHQSTADGYISTPNNGDAAEGHGYGAELVEGDARYDISDDSVMNGLEGQDMYFTSRHNSYCPVSNNSFLGALLQAV